LAASPAGRNEEHKHQRAELHPGHDRRERRERRPRLVRSLVGLGREPEEQVIEDPDRIEAHLLGDRRERPRLLERRHPAVDGLAEGHRDGHTHTHRPSLSAVRLRGGCRD